MLTKIHCSLILITLSFSSFSQDWIWSKFLDKSTYESFYNDLVCKGDYVYVTGGYKDSLKFEDGTMWISSSGLKDIFVMKMDIYGRVIWTRTFGRPQGDDEGNSIDVDSIGNAYIAASTFDTITGWSNTLFLKLDPDGSTIFSKEYAGTETGDAVKVLPSQDILFIGSFYDEVNLGGGNIVYGPPSGNGQSLFITKLTSAGDYIWGKMAGGQSYTSIFADNEIGVDQADNFYFTGRIDVYGNMPVYFDTIPIDLPGNLNTDVDSYLVKYDSLGNAQWVKRLAGVDYAVGTHVAVDAAGDILTCGYFDSELHFDGNTYSNGKSYLHKYHPDGNLVWGKELTGSKILDLTTDPANHIYAIANSNYSTDSIYIDSYKIHIQNGGTNFVVAKLDPAGNVLSFQNTDTTNTGIAGDGIVYNNQFLYLIGDYFEAVTLNETYHLDSSFVYHMGNFVTRLSTCSNPINPQITVSDTTLCRGDSISIRLSSTDIGEYIWNTGASADSIPVHEGGSYHVIFLDSSGCSSHVSNHVIIQQIEAIKPVITALNLFEACPGDSVFLQTGAGFLNYSWSNGDTYQYAFFTSSAGTFVSVTDTNNCRSSSDTMQVSFYAIPTGNYYQQACDSFTWIDGNTYLTDTDTVQFTLSGASMHGCDSIVTLHLSITNVNTNLVVEDPKIIAFAANAGFRWMDCDNAFQVIPGATDSLFIPNENGNYAVEIEQNGCFDTTACVTILTVDAPDLVSGIGLTISPNPSDGFVLIRFEDAEASELRIFDAQGRLIFEKLHLTKQTLELNLEQPAGLYYLEITSPGRKQRHKLMMR